jgi:two-component system, OmpR family, sensor histidine kinase KdpD
VDRVESLSMLQTMLSMLAHDLRSPLAAAITNLGFIEAVVPRWSADATDALADARLSCKSLEHLIANLDVLASIGQKRRTEEVSLLAIARSTVARFEPQARSSVVSFDVRGAEPLPDVVAAPALVERALDNLVVDALQHAPARSVVRVSVERRGDLGAIAVSDDGPVVPEELRAVVLTARGQAEHKKRIDARYGRGLALYCAAEAAMSAGAEVVVGERGGHSVLLLLAPFTAGR